MTASFSYPDDWEEVTLCELFEFSNGLNAEKAAYGHGTPFANVREVIINETLTDEQIPGRISLPPEILSRYRVNRGDVLFNRTSETQDEVGMSSVYLGDAPIVFGGFVFRGRPTTRKLTINYSKYGLRSADVRRQIVARGQGAIRANIGQRDLKTVRVVIPGVDEQEAIASVLTAAADLIATLDRLVEKKKAVKQGMAQQLLTGKTRLHGFSGAWVDTCAGAIGTFKGGNGFPVRFQGHGSGKFPFFKVSDMNSAGNEQFMRAAKNYIAENVRKQLGATVFPAQAIVFAKVGAAVFLERKRILEVPSCIDNNMAALLVDPVKADYRFVHRTLEAFRVSSLVATTALPSLNRTQLRSIPLRLPVDLDEQAAIARALADADAEIDLLKLRLQKSKAIKQGIAQQLLTGKTRLPVLEAVA